MYIYTIYIYLFFSNYLFTAFKLLAKIVGTYCQSCADLQTRPEFHRVELLCSQYHVTRVTNIPVSLPNPEQRVLHPENLSLPSSDNPDSCLFDLPLHYEPMYLTTPTTTPQQALHTRNIAWSVPIRDFQSKPLPPTSFLGCLKVTDLH